MDKIDCLIEKEIDDEEFDLLEAVQTRSEIEGWTDIVAESLSILSDKSKMEFWQAAVRIIFWSTSRTPTFPVPTMEIVARLYWCLINVEEGVKNEMDENLVWSVAKDLKGVPYLADWDPQRDPEVQAYLTEMKLA